MNRRASRRGQSAVEYILLLGFVATFAVLVKKTVVDRMFQTILPETVQSIRSEAIGGGRQVPGEMSRYYYQSQVTKK